VNAAKHFFRKAMKSVGSPRVITLHAYAASHRAVRELKSEGRLPKRVRVRSSKYLNNMIEQDHRRIKQRIRPMLGFKRFESAAVTISGIKLVQKIQKQQFKTGTLGGHSATMPELGMPCWPPDPKVLGTRGRIVHVQTLHQSLALCRMFHRAIREHSLPKYLSSDHDPLYRFHHWQANIRVLEVAEIKTIPYVPLSHPFVERLIGTVRREYLNRTLFWTTADLETSHYRGLYQTPIAA